MRFLVLLAAFAVCLPFLAVGKEREWRQGRVQNLSEQVLPPTLAGPTPESATRAGGGVATNQVRQTIAIEAGDEVFLVEMVCLEGQELRFPDSGAVSFALEKKDFLIRDQGGRTRKLAITWRGPKSKSPR